MGSFSTLPLVWKNCYHLMHIFRVRLHVALSKINHGKVSKLDSIATMQNVIINSQEPKS
jgi:hypothetical protein